MTVLTFKRINLKNDLATCIKFRKDSYVTSFPDSDDWMKYWNEQAYKTSLPSHAEKFPDGLWHVWLKSDIVGQLEFAYKESRGHINLFYLEPDYRGTGIASDIHAFVIGQLQTQGCKTATLRVTPQNTRARRYYEKHQWQDNGIDEHYDYVHLYTLSL